MKHSSWKEIYQNFATEEEDDNYAVSWEEVAHFENVINEAI
jgi:hypothetical protein